MLAGFDDDRSPAKERLKPLVLEGTGKR